MRRLGTWLMLIGLGVPAFMTAWSMVRAFNAQMKDHPAVQTLSADISRSLCYTMIGLPIGVLGAVLWLTAIIRDANRHRRGLADKAK